MLWVFSESISRMRAPGDSRMTISARSLLRLCAFPRKRTPKNVGAPACPGKGHAVMSVKVRPKPKDSGFEAREAPWRESKTAEPSDNMLERSVREASGCNVQ